eukprot:scaffold81188_cov75-Phaeocystis_antarctica.AAC.2
MPWPLPSPLNPLDSTPWPRGTAARPPHRAPRRWPRGRPWLLCASHAWSRAEDPQPPARRTCRPSARRAGPASPRPRDAAAASPHHPLASSAASSAPCDTLRAASKRQGSPGTRRSTSTSSAACA